MRELSEIIALATRNIEDAYIHLQIAGGDAVYRERVYCYELYHQMRCCWPNNSAYRLNGEVDKAAHPVLTGLGIGKAKPDLLVHGPGHMGHNHAIIEVKAAAAQKTGVRKDLRTLSRFVLHAGYARAIYLIYGDVLADKFVRGIYEARSHLAQCARIELWFHPSAGSPARELLTVLPK